MSALDQLDARQRRLLLLAAVVLIGALLYVQVWEPLVESRALERERIAEQQAMLDWLTAITPMAEQMRQQQTGRAVASDRSLLGLADETARAAGLAGSLTRIEPAGDNQVRVWLDGANFVATMSWLQQMSMRYPVEVSQLSVDRARQNGQVNVRVTLASNA